MKMNRTSIVTLALLGALALAALSADLLPLDRVAYAQEDCTPAAATNCTPYFPSGTAELDVKENTPPGVNIGDPVTATDKDESHSTGALEYGDTLTYSLEGTDAASFNIDPATGQISTKAALDYERPLGGTGNDSNTYQMRVKAKDSRGGVANRDVTIDVGDVEEAPAAPVPPVVTSGVDNPDTSETDESTTTLKVVWHAPRDKGDSISDYQVQYKESTETSFKGQGATTGSDNVSQTSSHDGQAHTATITGLKAGTSYQVRVRARKDESTPGLWSLVGTGATNKESNTAPKFAATEAVTLEVDENTPAGVTFGAAVSATDADASTLVYRLEGPDRGLFEFDASSRRMKTKASLDYEAPGCYYRHSGNEDKCWYGVTVTVFDGAGASDAIPVKIEVDDVNEPAAAPATPKVTATANSSRSLDVSWNDPANTGPAITGYNVRYRKGNSGAFLNRGVTVTGTTAVIKPDDDTTTNAVDERLEPNTSYEVQVQAANATEGAGFWSTSGLGRTRAANKEPIFNIRPSNENRNADRTIERTVAENTRAGQTVERAVTASDGNGDKLTYKLVESEDTDAARAQVAKFDIDKSNGRILTKAALNHEDSTGCGYDASATPTVCTYTVKVAVSDGLDEDRNEEETATDDDAITVKIIVRDVNEPPAAPVVTVTAPATEGTGSALKAKLAVTWDTPTNTGPNLASYEVRYRKGGGSYSDDKCGSEEADNCGTITGTNTTILDLDANTPYTVEVRAKDNTEGASAWTRVTARTNREDNAPPVYSTTTQLELSVAENTPSGQNVGSAVTATDTDTPTYSLEGPDRNSFAIISSTGQIKTKSSLNFEDAPCGHNVDANGRPDNTTCKYKVRVKVVDGKGGSAARDVVITVTNDDNEAPSAPSAPRVTATTGSGKSLEVTWNEPKNTGPAITDYDLGYREYKQGANNTAYTALTHTGTKREATITGLKPQTQYEVRVRAKNGEADATANWSLPGRGTTGKSNIRPEFDATSAVVTLKVSENERSGQDVGSPVSASDADGNSLTYSLGGPDAASFEITRSGNSGGQIRTKSGVKYDYETKDKYSVTVKVDDGQRKENSVASKSVTVEIDDRNEKPSAPSAPSVTGVPGSIDSIRVSWTEPANTGPPITGYDVHIRTGSQGFENWPHNGLDRSTIITEWENAPLVAGTRYQVQVRARSDEGVSDYSSSGTGSPNPDVQNQKPIFSAGTRSFSVAENAQTGTSVGAVSATDPDGDILTYSLEGTDAASFDIDGANGQIRTGAPLNHEAKARHSVTVRASDGRGGSATAAVTINVTDVAGEAPGTPDPPNVTAASSTRLSVSWDAPSNDGPAITDYDYRYRESTGGASWTEVTATTITSRSVTIDRLTASTFYDVQVRATNAEGTSDWSNSTTVTTNAPGANNNPVFSEGASAARSIHRTAAAGTSIGRPVTATDEDPDDTITYTLEGTDAASFDIDEDTGQISTKSGVTLTDVGTTYSVTVVASDGKGRAEIAVTISVIANVPPTFSSTSYSRSVRESERAGTNVGAPVTATDVDQGDTLTYSLSGTDAASFTITAATGQIATAAVLDQETKPAYSVTITVTDAAGATATATVTITVTDVTFGCVSNGAVPDASNAGLARDCEALREARDKLENGGTRLNWSEYTPIEQWNGVYFSGTPKRVTRVILRRMGLNGTVPAELGDVSMLVEINLHTNQLSGEIPAELNRLGSLEKLLLHNNRLSGTIPNLSGLRSLKYLWLSGKEMSLIGPVPSWLNSMSAMESLSLWGNDLTGPIPIMTGMTSLKLLKLQSNKLSGGVPSWLGQMSSLRGLYIHLNPLGGSIPSQLGNLNRLSRLWIHSSDLTGTIPAELQYMVGLRGLNLRDNDLTGPIPPQLGNMDSMQKLRLHNNRLSGLIPTQLGNLSNLTDLWLSGNDLTGAIPSQLGGLANLKQLSLRNNQLSGAVPAELGNLADTLTHFYLVGNTGLSGCVPSALSGVTNNDVADTDLSYCP